MGAVALSRIDEEVLETLRKTLDLPSKAQVIHRALEDLQRAVARERLARDIRSSVQKCGKEDLEENRILAAAAVHRTQPA